MRHSELAQDHSTTADAETFFQQVVIDYNCGDVQLLLDLKLTVAGPLLASTVNGIDLIGGMIYGFKDSRNPKRSNSMRRSVDFMAEHLRLDAAVAKLIYKHYRCGFLHSGIPTYRTVFFVNYERDPKDIIYSLEEILILDVTALARAYLSAVAKIFRESRHLARHLPERGVETEEVKAGVQAIRAGIMEFERNFPDGNWGSGSGYIGFLQEIRSKFPESIFLSDPYRGLAKLHADSPYQQ